MIQKEFTIEINAKSEFVWFSLWDDAHYRNWTSVFCEGSYAESDWKEGSKILFLSPGGSGMSSKIVKNKPFESMQFEHISSVKNYEEMPIDEETAKWSGCKECYYLEDRNGTTLLKAVLDLDEKHLDFFMKAFPAGLQKVKEIAENMFIQIETSIEAEISKIWSSFNEPAHVMKWNHATDDWHTTNAVSDFKVGGGFSFRMEAKDGSFGFDFSGTYTSIENLKKVAYKLDDERKVTIEFIQNENEVRVIESFEPEHQNPLELQKMGWGMILENFKKYVVSQQ